MVASVRQWAASTGPKRKGKAKIGEIRERKGGQKWKKVARGKWVEVTSKKKAKTESKPKIEAKPESKKTKSKTKKWAESKPKDDFDELYKSFFGEKFVKAEKRKEAREKTTKKAKEKQPPSKELKGKLPDNLIGKVTTADKLPGTIKETLGFLGLTKFPPPKIPKSDVKVDLSGDVHSHALVTWRDAKGRQQSSYSSVFKQRNAARKWERVKNLAPKFDDAQSKFRDVMETAKTARERDAAVAMLIITETGLRPGSREHFSKTGNRGVSTLSPNDVAVRESTVAFKFKGKSGKENFAKIEDEQLARYMSKRKEEKAGSEFLFEIKGDDLSDLMDESGLGEFKPKDFRTLRAGKLAAKAFAEAQPPPPVPDGKKGEKLIQKRIREVSEEVAEYLNNTPAVARSSYINPAIIQAWQEEVTRE
jgi:DNA topoisomerase IB